MSFLEDVKAAAEPLRFGKVAMAYRLSLPEIAELRGAAADEKRLMELVFAAGFAAGRKYEKEH